MASSVWLTMLRCGADAYNVLPGHGPQQTMAGIFQELANSLNRDELPDRYGNGAYLAEIEAELHCWENALIFDLRPLVPFLTHLLA